MTNKELLAIAIKNLGKGGAVFREYVGLSGGQPWCDAFVYWLFNANGCESLLPWKASQRYFCPDSIKWCKENLAQIPLYMAQPCDLIYFDWELNKIPNHIGIVEKKKSASAICTIEGNTDGGKVARKTRNGKYVQAVFRPHFAPPKELSKSKLTIDADFGFKSVYMLQVTLGIEPTGILTKETVMAWQKKVGATPDGVWGSKTTVASQKFLKVKPDKVWGKASTEALQKWINKINYPQTVKRTSYRIEVDLTNQITTVYGVYSDGTKKPIMSEWVSTARKGRTTPIGTFKIQGWKGRKAKYRTALMSSGKAYAEFLVRFKGAKCMHTVPYKTRNTKGYVTKSEFNKLGTPRSAGCVRMPYKMAKFIYNNCPLGTPVIVFKGKEGDYPMGAPKKYIATSNVDPTK